MELEFEPLLLDSGAHRAYLHQDNEEMQSYHELEGKSEYSWTALMTTTSGAYQNEADI